MGDACCPPAAAGGQRGGSAEENKYEAGKNGGHSGLMTPPERPGTSRWFAWIRGVRRDRGSRPRVPERATSLAARCRGAQTPTARESSSERELSDSQP